MRCGFIVTISDVNIENLFVSIFIDIFLKISIISIFTDIVFFILTRRKNAQSEANLVFMEYVVKGLTNRILFWKILAVFWIPDKALKHPGHIFESAPNISRISLGFLCNFSVKLFHVSIILCKFFQKSPWKFQKISIKMIFKSLYKVFSIFFLNFY